MRYLALVALMALLVVPMVGCKKETPAPASPEEAVEGAGGVVEDAAKAAEVAAKAAEDAAKAAGEEVAE